METVTFDVMCDGRFIMQHTHKWCGAFKIDMNQVLKEIYERRPTLVNKKIELYQTQNILKWKR